MTVTTSVSKLSNNHQTFYSLLQFHFPVAGKLFYKTTQDISTINPNDIKFERPLKKLFTFIQKGNIYGFI